MTIAILYGGQSLESDYSKKSAHSLKVILEHLGSKILMINLHDTNWVKLLLNMEINVIIDLVYGCPGQEGTIKGLADILQIKYLGSDIFAHSLVKDKYLAKLVCSDNSVKTPDFTLISKEQYYNKQDYFLNYIYNKLGFPCIVKPRRLGGLSLGINYCNDLKGLSDACEEGFNYDGMLLIEKYISGTEISICVVEMDNKINVLPALKVTFPSEDYICNYETKIRGNRNITIWDNIPANIEKELQKNCVNLFNAFNIKDFGYFDFIINDKIYFIEAGVTPGLTSNSNLVLSLNYCEIDMATFFLKLISKRMDKYESIIN